MCLHVLQRASLFLSLSLSLYIYVYTSNTSFSLSPAGLRGLENETVVSDAWKESALTFWHRMDTERCLKRENFTFLLVAHYYCMYTCLCVLLLYISTSRQAILTGAP